MIDSIHTLSILGEKAVKVYVSLVNSQLSTLMEGKR